MPIASFGGKDIPYVYQLELRRDFIGDRERTAGGNMRQDLITTKKRWMLRTRRMTKAEADNLLSHLESNNYKADTFKLDELSTSGVTAYIPPEDIRENRMSFRRDGTWHDDGRELTFTVVQQ